MAGRGLTRWLRHAFTPPGVLRRAFPAGVLASIRRAIHAAEAGHSGEIRFVIETSLPWSYLRHDAPARHRALSLFSKLRVWDTEHNNGVMIYVGLADRAVEVLADRGLANRVDAATWRTICDRMRQHFARGGFEAGAVEAVAEVGALLARHFPLAPGEQRRNEMPDRPVVL